MSKLFRLLRVIPAGAKGTPKELHHEESYRFVHCYPRACEYPLKSVTGGRGRTSANVHSIAVPNPATGCD